MIRVRQTLLSWVTVTLATGYLLWKTVWWPVIRVTLKLALQIGRCAWHDSAASVVLRPSTLVESWCGAIAQLGERNTGSVEVGGSIPPSSTNFSKGYFSFLILFLKDYNLLLKINLFINARIFIYFRNHANRCNSSIFIGRYWSSFECNDWQTWKDYRQTEISSKLSWKRIYSFKKALKISQSVYNPSKSASHYIQKSSNTCQ